MDWLVTIFGEQDDLNAWQECARAVLIVAYGLVVLRLAGRRIFGKWAALDIVASIIVGSNLSRIITGNAPFVGTLAATTLIIALHWIIAHLAARLPTLSYLVEGGPIRIGEKGRIAHDVRLRHAVTECDLNEALRQCGIERAEETEKVTLEPSGKITVIKKG